MPAELTRATPAYVDLVRTMGTVVTLDVRAGSRPAGLEDAVARVADLLERIDQTYSTWLRDSWVSRAVRGEVLVSDCPQQVRDVADLAERLADLTGGYFSPHWQGTPGPDPTGLVKGWAAQQASDVLLAHGLEHHVVNAAGDLVVSGSPFATRDASPWRIGITDPLRAGALAGAVELPSGPWRWAVATSGTAELGRHVVDPHTGAHPGEVASATVVTDLRRHPEAGAVADACATALVAAGADAAALLERLGRRGVPAFVLHADGTRTDPGGLLVRAG